MSGPRRRKRGNIDKLPDELREAVEQMILASHEFTYGDILDYLQQHHVSTSVSAICRYARGYMASVEKINAANENARRLMEEIDKYPNLDATEALIRLATDQILNTLATAPEDAWTGIQMDKLLREANGLIKATTSKRRADMQGKSQEEAGLDALQQRLFDAMAREEPELYEALSKFLDTKREAFGEGEDQEDPE